MAHLSWLWLVGLLCVLTSACAQVHKIAVLDLRLVNTDRHGGNVLFKRTPQGLQLTPIDHGYCLPASWQDVTLEWLFWPQVCRLCDSLMYRVLVPGPCVGGLRQVLEGCHDLINRLPVTTSAMVMQAARPFSAQTLAYISRLDAEADLALLESNGLHLRPECQRIFKVGCLAAHMPQIILSCIADMVSMHWCTAMDACDGSHSTILVC